MGTYPQNQLTRWAVVALAAPALTSQATVVVVDFDGFGATGGVPQSAYYNEVGPTANTVYPLLDDQQQPTGLTFEYQKPQFDFQVGSNVPVYSFYQPTGFDLDPLGGSLGIQLPGHALQFDGLTPGSQYDLWLLTWTYEASFSPPMNFAVTGAGNWSEFAPPDDVNFGINGVQGSTSRTFDSYARRFTADPSGALRFESTTGDFTAFFGVVLEELGPPPPQGTIEVTPLIDGGYENDQGFLSLDTTGPSMTAQDVGFLPLNKRMMMEFDLSQIPEGAEITSASIAMNLTSWSSSGGEYASLELFAQGSLVREGDQHG